MYGYKKWGLRGTSEFIIVVIDRRPRVMPRDDISDKARIIFIELHRI